jgi:CubicO group peptidase (beta-lactamase class C family)
MQASPLTSGVRRIGRSFRPFAVRSGGRAAALVHVAVVALLALQLASPPAARADSAPDFAAIDAYVAGQLRAARVPGAALGIVRGDEVAHLRGFGVADRSGRAVTAQTPFVIGSVSKSFTALAVMQLVEAGKVELNAPAQRYLPWFQVADPTAAAEITVRHLLNQTSGLPTSAGLTPLSGPTRTLEAQVRALADVALASPPGERYAYSNANYEILGLLVEAASGEPYEVYVARHIFAPLGMRHSHTAKADAERDGLGDGHRLFFGARLAESPGYRPDYLPAGWLISSAEDLTHYVVAQLNGGRYGDAAVLSPAGIEELHRPAAKQSTPAGDASYGMGWVTSTVNGIQAIWHNGSTGDMHAIVLIEPHGRWGVALLYNATGTLYELAQNLDAVAWGVMSLLAGRQPGGTLVGLYIGFDLLVAVVTGAQIRSLVRLLRGRVTTRRARWSFLRWLKHPALSAAWTGYGTLLAPVALLAGLPRFFSTPWHNLARTDLGLWLLLFAILQLAQGAVWLTRLPRLRAVLRGFARSTRPVGATGD